MSKKIPTPDWDHFVAWPHDTSILAFDQSLANTGWAFVHFIPGHRPVVEAKGTLVTRPHDDLSGFADSFVRGENLHDMALSILTSVEPDVVVHEEPVPMGRMVSRKQEGAPVAALAVRIATRRAGFTPVMVPIRRCKAWVTGNPNAEKSQMRQGVLAALGVSKMSLNEHTTDAIGLAIAAALDGHHGEVV